MVDALGNLFCASAGPAPSMAVDPLLDGTGFETSIADRAYDSNALRDELQERGATAVIRADRVEEIACDREL